MNNTQKVSSKFSNYFFILWLMPLILTGCETQLKATKLSGEKVPAEGLVYFLPSVEFTITLDRELKSCNVKFEQEGDGVIEWLRDVSAKLDKLQTENEVKSAHGNLLKDPIFKRPDISAYLNSKLSSTWRPVTKPAITNKAYLSQLITGKVKTKIEPILYLDVSMKAQANPVIVPDENHVYSIQYRKMQDYLKGTNFSVESFPNGTLKSINVTLDDQTGNIIQSSISGLAKIAATSTGVPLPLGTSQSLINNTNIPEYSNWIKAIQNEQVLCNSDTLLKLALRDASALDLENKAKNVLQLSESVSNGEKELENTKNSIDESQKLLDGMTSSDLKRKALSDKVAALKVQAKLTQSTLEANKKAHVSAIESFNKASAQVEILRKKVTLTTVTSFKPDRQNNNKVFFGAQDALQSWLDIDKVKRHCGKNSTNCIEGWPSATLSKLNAYTAVYPSFQSLTKIEVPTDNSVVYRQPVKSSLIICKEKVCLDSDGLIVEPQNILLSSLVDIPQFGVLASLPLVNKTFQNNALTASFAENGALTKLTYTTNAIASKAAETFSSTADTFFKFKEAKSKEGKTKLENSNAEVEARTKLLESQLKQEMAQDELNKFRDSLNVK